MSIYEVHFIKEANDPEEKHLVVEVEALNPDEAELKARGIMSDKKISLAPYGFWAREVKRF